jgi:hypothetical protein
MPVMDYFILPVSDVIKKKMTIIVNKSHISLKTAEVSYGIIVSLAYRSYKSKHDNIPLLAKYSNIDVYMAEEEYLDIMRWTTKKYVVNSILNEYLSQDENIILEEILKYVGGKEDENKE